MLGVCGACAEQHLENFSQEPQAGVLLVLLAMLDILNMLIVLVVLVVLVCIHTLRNLFSLVLHSFTLFLTTN
ncbi:hypothetical protein SY83_13020 [Paenibacillus swuensis]|uniref:Uncharacterized protein n=1 Tax=Paenibacillus swuensis TaxID=1178515 RepID=A0A172TJ25_9BACL|nr:hypothetical protein [Paenibacillus swuensis]ANE47038.1 hypothetical protein SY83_13020 [Paenibacillus swuensis]